MTDHIIQTQALHFSYLSEQAGDSLVLENVNLEITQGQFVAILGHNGSGKSTLAKHMNALLLPMGGKVWVDGMDTGEDKNLLDIHRTAGMVFQNPDNQLVANVVEEDVAFAPENLGVAQQEIRKRVDNALDAVAMKQFSQHAPHLLSGGQKQRIAIAGVLAMAPKCIILDEPTAMLDPKGRQEVMQVIHTLHQQNAVTVILITHHMDEAAQAQRVLVMSKGQVVADDSPQKIFSQVEMLQRYGLTAPETSLLLHELRQAGLPVSQEALDEDACVREIAALFGKTDTTAMDAHR